MNTFHFPIATRPADPRDHCRLLVIDRASGAIEHRRFYEIVDFFKSGDCLVLNNSKVFPARIPFEVAENPLTPSTPLRAGPPSPPEKGERVRVRGELLLSALPENGRPILVKMEGKWAKKLKRTGGSVRFMTSKEGRIEILDFHEKEKAFLVKIESAEPLENFGLPPLPPYILKTRKVQQISRESSIDPLTLPSPSQPKADPPLAERGEGLGEGEQKNSKPSEAKRVATEEFGISQEDRQDSLSYQCVYASEQGSIAGPTAGFHWTPELLKKVEEQGVNIVTLTLHIGFASLMKAPDESVTRLPVESFDISARTAQAINQARLSGNRVVACGTSATRTLETLADTDGGVKRASGETDLFIKPGYRFKAVDVLLTNFHLPDSTNFMLTQSFVGAGADLLSIYQEAAGRDYRFFSYGDAMLIL